VRRISSLSAVSAAGASPPHWRAMASAFATYSAAPTRNARATLRLGRIASCLRSALGQAVWNSSAAASAELQSNLFDLAVRGSRRGVVVCVAAAEPELGSEVNQHVQQQHEGRGHEHGLRRQDGLLRLPYRITLKVEVVAECHCQQHERFKDLPSHDTSYRHAKYGATVAARKSLAAQVLWCGKCQEPPEAGGQRLAVSASVVGDYYLRTSW